MGLYLVAYDIRDRNRWHKVHHMLIAQALPIQYSVFLFNGSRDAFERCMSALTSIIDPREDDLRFYEQEQSHQDTARQCSREPF